MKKHGMSGGMSRRSVMQGSLMAAAASGTATFFGPWHHNRVWAQGAKPNLTQGMRDTN